MRRCLQLAGIASGYTAPNPMVGALLVCNDKIIGEGYHRRYGQPHAEPNAINSVKDKSLLSRSTLYVNLEPCSHFGKTPPCANLIVNSGIPRVVIGTFDPNPKVAGRGVKILEDAGIEVVVGVLEAECRALNRRFFIYQEEKRPFVLLKWAQTSDGYLDRVRTDNEKPPLSISNEITRQLTHKNALRKSIDYGESNTVLLDNPSLTVRNWSGKNPVRIALDRQGRIPKNYNLLNGRNQTLIFTGNPGENGHNLEFIPHTFDENSLQTILNMHLQKRNSFSIGRGRC
jgi:diaminohydroxyphosphoribosylaminopyrimidine deaminase/5-amino-6-(5-phosphoribosylamino)uracil reductase